MSIGTGNRAKRKKHLRRPRKAESEKKRRHQNRLRRLVVLGVPEEQAAVLSPLAARELLKRPKKLPNG